MTFANVSGGRDSTAMVVKWLESWQELDHIIFCDTGYEFGEMQEYISKLDSYLRRHFDKKITILKPEQDLFVKWAFEYPITKGENAGKLRGLPKAIGMSYCTREFKANPSRKFIHQKSPNRFKNVALIGYTHGEVERGRVSNLDYAIARYPIHEWEMNEPEVEEFLKNRGIANPLYKHFDRTGCYFCPKQSKASLYALFKHYPKEWARAKEFEHLAQQKGALTQTFKPERSLEELEREFRENPKMDFSEEYEQEQVCFCK